NDKSVLLRLRGNTPFRRPEHSGEGVRSGRICYARVDAIGDRVPFPYNITDCVSNLCQFVRGTEKRFLAFEEFRARCGWSPPDVPGVERRTGSPGGEG